MIISIRVFDWINQRVLCHTRRAGHDHIEWLDMNAVYANQMEAI